MLHEALILAAGFGERLRERSACKPLTKLHGLTLLEIGVRQLMRAGVTKVVVVIGHQADMMEEAVAALSLSTGLDIETARLENWSKPNGWSVLAGAKRLEGPFLLTMADHVFGDGVLEALSKRRLDDCAVVLATDTVTNPLIDPEDATWVALDADHRIKQIGKTIAPYDAVDCGAFLADAGLAEAIERAIADGKAGSLSEGMQVLADAGLAATMDIGGLWWIDVDDPRALDLALVQGPEHIGILAENGTRSASRHPDA